MKLPDLNLKRIYFAGLIILVAVCSGIVFYQTSCRTDVVQQAVENNRIESQTAASESANAQKAAANSSQERRTEDEIREKTIKPRLEAARRKSAQSAQEIEVLRRRYENEKQNLHDSNASRASNCSELHALFPDEKFDYCGSGSGSTGKR